MEKWSPWYAFMKVAVSSSLHHYYRFQIAKEGLHQVPKGVPILFVSNHQNALMDALLITTALPHVHQPAFIVRSDVFANPVLRALFNSFKMMPIYRQRDKVNVVEKNQATFEQCCQLLTNSASIIIFPEANQERKKRLRNLKKGFSRIVFKAAAANNFEQPIFVVPLGINYDQHLKAGGKIYLSFGKPIDASAYYDLYQEHEQKAFRQLTKVTQTAIAQHIVNINPLAHHNTIETLIELYTPSMIQRMNLKGGTRYMAFKAQQKTAQVIEATAKNHPDFLTSIAPKTERYTKHLQQLNLQDHTLKNRPYKKTNLWLQTFLMVLLFPLFLHGLVYNFLPYKISEYFAKRRVKDLNFYTSTVFVLGFILFPIFYLLSAIFIGWLLGSKLLAFLYFISFSVAGVFASYYWSAYKKLKAKWRFWHLQNHKNETLAQALLERSLLIQNLEDVLEV